MTANRCYDRPRKLKLKSSVFPDNTTPLFRRCGTARKQHGETARGQIFILDTCGGGVRGGKALSGGFIE